MLPHERLLGRRGPATPEDLEKALHAAVAAGELEEDAGRRLLDLVASMRGSGSASIPDTMLGLAVRRTTSTTKIGRNGR